MRLWRPDSEESWWNDETNPHRSPWLPSPCRSAIMQGFPMESMWGTQEFPGVEPRTHTASGRSEDSELGHMRGNKEVGQEECGNISIYFIWRWWESLSPERRARTRSGHKVRRQTEGYLSWGILGTRATMKKRQLYYCRGKNCLVVE